MDNLKQSNELLEGIQNGNAFDKDTGLIRDHWLKKINEQVVKNNVALANVSVSLEEKTERLALEAYPVQMGNVCGENDWDYNEQYRDCWIEGFKKANSR